MGALQGPTQKVLEVWGVLFEEGFGGWGLVCGGPARFSKEGFGGWRKFFLEPLGARAKNHPEGGSPCKGVSRSKAIIALSLGFAMTEGRESYSG